MKKAILIIISIVVGFFVNAIVSGFLMSAISFLGKIPLLGAILYFPSDAAWSLLVIPIPTGIFAASFCGKIISGTTKWTAAFLFVLYALELVLSLLTAFSFSALIRNAFAVATAAICFFEE